MRRALAWIACTHAVPICNQGSDVCAVLCCAGCSLPPCACVPFVTNAPVACCTQGTFASMIEGAGFKAVGYENIMGGVVALHSGFKLP